MILKQGSGVQDADCFSSLATFGMQHKFPPPIQLKCMLQSELLIVLSAKFKILLNQ